MKVDKRVTSRSRCPSAFDSRYSAGRKFFLHALSRGNLASSTSHVSPLRQPRLAHDTTRRYFGGCTSIVAASLPGDSLFSASRSHPSSAPNHHPRRPIVVQRRRNTHDRRKHGREQNGKRDCVLESRYTAHLPPPPPFGPVRFHLAGV